MEPAKQSPVTRPPQGVHVFAEAFRVMRYEGPGGRREWIWNSRDGITPFIVESIDGTVNLDHGNWHLDRYEPYHVPAVGARVFVDLTEELARPIARAQVERAWEAGPYPMIAHPAFEQLGKDGTVEYFVKTWVADWGGHAPHVVIVTEVLHAQFTARAAAPRAMGGRHG